MVPCLNSAPYMHGYGRDGRDDLRVCFPSQIFLKKYFNGSKKKKNFEDFLIRLIIFHVPISGLCFFSKMVYTCSQPNKDDCSNKLFKKSGFLFSFLRSECERINSKTISTTTTTQFEMDEIKIEARSFDLTSITRLWLVQSKNHVESAPIEPQITVCLSFRSLNGLCKTFRWGDSGRVAYGKSKSTPPPPQKKTLGLGIVLLFVMIVILPTLYGTRRKRRARGGYTHCTQR